MRARLLASIAIIALAAWIVAWQTLLLPPAQLPAAVAMVLHLAPLAPALVLLALRRRSAPYWGAVASLFLFCHGVAEAWSLASSPWVAWIEILLSLAIIFAASWEGLRARVLRRRDV